MRSSETVGTGFQPPYDGLLCQQVFHHFFDVVVSPYTAMAETHDTVAIDHELRRPEVAEIIAPDFLIVIDQNRKPDAHPGTTLNTRAGRSLDFSGALGTSCSEAFEACGMS